jgi:flavodoxin
MKAIVVYDTKFGNTEKVAKTIAKILSADIFRVGEVDISKLMEYDVFVAGSPTHAWNMSSGMKTFFKKLKGESFEGKKAATFDTKYKSRFAGSAAKKIQSKLKKLDFKIVLDPVSFIVTGNEGPLAEGEIEKTKAFSALFSS